MPSRSRSQVLRLMKNLLPFCCQERSTAAESPWQLFQLYPGENEIAFLQCCESDFPFLDKPMDLITWARICHQHKRCGTGHQSQILRTVFVACGSWLQDEGFPSDDRRSFCCELPSSPLCWLAGCLRVSQPLRWGRLLCASKEEMVASMLYLTWCILTSHICDSFQK